MKEYKYTIDGETFCVSIDNMTDSEATVSVNGETYHVQMEPEPQPEKKKVVLGAPETAAPAETSSVQPANINTQNAVKAPLPGVITDIKVSVGQQVSKGDVVIVLEAMKMANNLEAEKDGTVSAICVKVGENVMEDAPLVVID